MVWNPKKVHRRSTNGLWSLDDPNISMSMIEADLAPVEDFEQCIKYLREKFATRDGDEEISILGPDCLKPVRGLKMTENSRY